MANIYESVNLLSKHIGQYYEEHTGVTPETGKAYSCVIPGHADKRPSMVFYDTHFWCFSCHKRIDICVLASIFDQKPLNWYEGYTEQNLNYLLAKYDYAEAIVESEHEKLASVIVPFAADYFKRELRNAFDFLTDDLAHEIGVGILDRPNELMASLMESYNISQDDIYSVLSPVPFGTDKVTYVVSDQMNRPVGFTFRNLSYKAEIVRQESGEKITPRKYLWCGMTVKTTIPFGLSDIRESKGLPIIVVESPKTKIFTKACGVHNVISLCGSNASKQILRRLASCGIRSLSLCLDNDAAGHNGVKLAIENMYKEGIWFDLTVVDWPVTTPKGYNIEDVALESGDDVAFGIVSYPISVPEFLIKRFGMDGYKTAVHYASLNPMEGLRSKIATHIAHVFGVSSNAVHSDVEKAKFDADKKRALTLTKDLEAVTQKTQKLLSLGSITPQQAIDTITNRVELANKQKDTSRDFSQQSVLESVNEIICSNENRDAEKRIGWTTGLWFFDNDMEGMPKSQSTIILGASPNVGKSAFCVNLATNMLLSPDNEDLFICFISNDDSAKKTVPKFISRLSGIQQTYCKHPTRYITTNEEKHRYQTAVEQLQHFLDPSNPKMCIYDVSSIQTERQCVDLVRSIQDTYGKKVVMFLDNFHNIQIPAGESSTQSRESLITTLHNSTIATEYTLILTAEVRKQTPLLSKQPPMTEDLKDSVKLGYVPTIVGLLWSSWWAYGHPDYLDNNRNDVLYYYDQNNNKHPILECYIDKNKADMLNNTSNKVKLYFKTDYSCCKFEDISPDSPEIQHTAQGNSSRSQPVGPTRKQASSYAPQTEASKKFTESL